MFVPKTEIGCTIEEFNQHLNFCKKYRNIIFEEAPFKTCEQIKYKAYLDINPVEVNLTYKNDNGRNQTFITRLDGEPVDIQRGLDAFREMSLFYKVPRANFSKKFSASGILWLNEKYNNQRHQNCYGYDINSAYSWALLQPMPDTSIPVDHCRDLKLNEIGLDCNNEIVLTGFAHLIWPKIKSPFVEFVNKWYNKKQTAPKGSKERQYAKNIMNMAIGYLQRVNPILRTFVLDYANKRVKSFINDDTLYCNTDSIVSLTQRFDIEENLGDGLGQWKLEHFGDFAYKGFCYQWNKSIPSYRGVSKSWFKPDFDILVDELPECGNLYFYNPKTNQIERLSDEKDKT